MTDVDPRDRGPGQALPDHPRHRVQDDGRRTSRRSTASTSSLQRGRDPRRGRRVGLRQVDPGPAAGRPGEADRRARSRYEGQDICKLDAGGDCARLRRNIQLVMQDPYTSLNPRMTVGDIVGEPFEIHPEVAPQGQPRPQGAGAARPGRSQPRAHQPLPAPVLRRPAPAHRHRPGAGAASPEIIVCDEPVSALDVSIQAQVMNLLEKLQNEFGLSYIFIAHDLSVVRHIADRVAVMYLGKIVEIGTDDEIYDRPTHPYTQALLSAVPVPDPTLRGQPAIRSCSRATCRRRPTRPRGCRFRTRCWKAQEICASEEPLLEIRRRRRTRAPATSRRCATWCTPSNSQTPRSSSAHRPVARVSLRASGHRHRAVGAAGAVTAVRGRRAGAAGRAGCRRRRARRGSGPGSPARGTAPGGCRRTATRVAPT